MKNSDFIIVFSIFLTTALQAQIIDSANRIDWSISGLNDMVYPQKIEDVAQLYNLAGDGLSDDGVKIQGALNAATSGTVLYFQPGTYLLENSLEIPANLIIRGKSASTTKFEFKLANSDDPDDDCITIANYDDGNYVDAQSGYTKGSTALTVSDVSDFTIGSYGEIKQDNDADVMYTDSRWDVSWAEDAVGQVFKIVDIQANTLSIWPPLNLTFQNNLNPQVRPNGLIENVGIENISIERLDEGEGSNIVYKNAANCWLWNINSKKTVRSHVWTYSCLNLQIRESLFHESFNYGGGGHGYGITFAEHTTNSLVENNVFKTLRHAMMVKEGANGNVFAYNFSLYPYWTGTTSSNLPPDISIHGHYPFMNLFEGNIVHRIGNSDYWGPSGPGNTFLRNRVQTNDFSVEDFSHYQNLIGNEITGTTNEIDIDSSVDNTLLHGNNDNGILIWDNNIPNQILPSSYYLEEFWDLNEFWTNAYDFPTIGPEFVFNSGSIPAEDRFDKNEENDCYTGRSKKYLNYTFPDATNEIMKNIITTDSTVTVLSNSVVQLQAANYLQFTNGFEVELGAEFMASIFFSH